ncbi:MAG: hypothetical protein HZB55_09585 [Deltaproteobacteria bacterium]|nr:hypothetical protein [Deltaproteobacteria bacterium]
MKTLWTLAALAGALAAAAPGNAAVDVLDRLVEKGILTQAERDELKKEEPKVTLGYKNNFFLTSPDNKFRLDIYGYGQVRYTFTGKEDGDNTDNFGVQRLRLGFRGHAFTEKLKYGVLLNVYPGENTSTNKDVNLFDFFVDYTPWNELGVKVGQFKVPYSTSWNLSASGLQFVERSSVDSNFRLDRDTGVDVHGNLLGTLLSYDVGMFNGEGWNKTNAADTKHLYVARVSSEPFGKYPFHESDNELSKSFLAHLSAAAAYNDDLKTHSIKNLNDRLTTLGQSDVKSFNGFVGMKFRGASVQAEGYHRVIASQEKGKETARGGYVQAGYFVYRDVVEAAARCEYCDPNREVADDLKQEYGGGLNWFFAGHRNKLQTDLFRVQDQKTGLTDRRLRLQYELQF